MANETMSLISTVTVGSGGAASIDFTSIAGSFTDLVIKFSGRWTSSELNSVGVTLNSNGSGYTSRWLTGSGSGASSSNTTVGIGGYASLPGTAATSNTFSNIDIYFPNYAGSTNKSFSADAVGENNATLAYQSIVANLWANTAAITSISLNPFGGGTLAEYSTASLYGIKSGSGGATVS